MAGGTRSPKGTLAGVHQQRPLCSDDKLVVLASTYHDAYEYAAGGFFRGAAPGPAGGPRAGTGNLARH